MTRRLPPSASVANPLDNAKLSAPSALRNAEEICAVLKRFGPAKGRALEIASGTGEHVVRFAPALPGLIWQPSELDPDRRASIDAWVSEAELDNIRLSIPLNAAVPGWGAKHAGQDLVVLVNLLHLISIADAECLIGEVAQALAPGGRFVLYGPFLRDGVATSDGDARFHASLTATDPKIGYKDYQQVLDWMRAAGLTPVDVVDMPANNLCLIAARGS